jgi:hypothetical protein
MNARTLLLWMISGLLLVGCSGSAGTGASMSGKVTLDGKPIVAGTIQVMPNSGQGQPVGGSITNGAYSLKDAPLGKVTILLQATTETGNMYNDNGTMRPELRDLIPPAAKAGIEKENKVGENLHDIAITSS